MLSFTRQFCICLHQSQPSERLPGSLRGHCWTSGQPQCRCAGCSGAVQVRNPSQWQQPGVLQHAVSAAGIVAAEAIFEGILEPHTASSCKQASMLASVNDMLTITSLRRRTCASDTANRAKQAALFVGRCVHLSSAEHPAVLTTGPKVQRPHLEHLHQVGRLVLQHACQLLGSHRLESAQLDGRDLGPQESAGPEG